MDKYKVCTAALSLALLLSLTGCTLGTPAASPTPSPTQTVAPTPSPGEVAAEEFVRTFSETYPGYQLLDYVVGKEENAPIWLVGVAQDPETGSSSTLFILDDTGTPQKLGLASGSYAVYREKDGIRLEGNVIHLSLDVSNSAAASLWEIHDFAITFTQEMENGVPVTRYTVDGGIRSQDAS